LRGQTPLLIAVEHDQCDVVLLLVKEMDVRRAKAAKPNTAPLPNTPTDADAEEQILMRRRMARKEVHLCHLHYLMYWNDC